MRRLWLSLLIVLLLAACSSAPQKISRGSSGQASVDALRTAPPGLPNFVDHSVGREEISIQAMSLVGVPYRWGGNTPDSGFDCSGLVDYVVARAASVNLPRTTTDISSRGESIEPDEIAPGDLIFFNTTGRPHSHVGIYVGKLRFVNAPSTGGTVRLDYLTNPYWAKRFDGIRRVAAPATKPAPFNAPTYLAAPPASAAGQPAYAATSAATSAQPALTAAAESAARVAQASRAPVATADTQPAMPADPYEPPPSGMSTAQVQTRAAGAVTPPVSAAVQRPSAEVGVDAPSAATADARPSDAPDAIDAAADAFEPPPLAAVAARQAQQAQQAGSSPGSRIPSNAVRIMRASTASRGIPAPSAPSAPSDDPIARFANGSD
jgi:hypothetical protein